MAEEWRDEVEEAKDREREARQVRARLFIVVFFLWYRSVLILFESTGTAARRKGGRR